jgi:hypothetical protein
VVFVEGTSDQRALEALAARLGRDLDAEAISIVSLGGSKNIGRFVERYRPPGSETRLAGLCDAAEEGDFQRALERAGFGADLTRDDMERLGFYVCVTDLEDELIRALGPDPVEQVIEAMGDLGAFRTFQRQPEWRGRSRAAQFHRFLGAGSGRKIRSAPMLIEALDLDDVPRPLRLLLAHV